MAGLLQLAGLLDVFTHTAPFLNPFKTANAALYFSRCRRLLTVYRSVFIRSGPAMTFSGAEGTQMHVAHTFRNDVSQQKSDAVQRHNFGSYVNNFSVEI